MAKEQPWQALTYYEANLHGSRLSRIPISSLVDPGTESGQNSLQCTRKVSLYKRTRSSLRIKKE